MQAKIEGFGSDGEVYRLRSGYDGFAWTEVLGRKDRIVKLPVIGDMEEWQWLMAKECIGEVKDIVERVDFVKAVEGEEKGGGFEVVGSMKKAFEMVVDDEGMMRFDKTYYAGGGAARRE